MNSPNPLHSRGRGGAEGEDALGQRQGGVKKARMEGRKKGRKEGRKEKSEPGEIVT